VAGCGVSGGEGVMVSAGSGVEVRDRASDRGGTGFFGVGQNVCDVDRMRCNFF